FDNMGFHPYTYAVFGAMHDKDIDGVISHMKGRIDHWCVTDLPSPRAATAKNIQERLFAAGIQNQNTAESSVETFTTPAEAFANAMKRAGENDRIAVFGSFLTVAGVMIARRAEYH
ncbi:MAG: glutamate ligase domain-containing protein, partial [Burkholderiaceae bacterium]